LIKDNDLEVRYHSGKVNVVPDMLIHNACCNYLHVVLFTEEKSSILVHLDRVQYNLTLTSLLRVEIISAQKKYDAISEIKRRLKEGDTQVKRFHEDEEGTLWFKGRIVVPKDDGL
jgi:hypothetical protein